MRTWNQTTRIVLFALLAVALALSVVLTVRTPQVRAVLLPTGRSGVEVLRPSATIRFSSPMNKDAVVSSLLITPVVEYTVSWQGNDLRIYFANGLDLGQEYTIKIGSAAKDVFNKGLAQDYEYKFVTKQPAFTYIQKNGRGKNQDKLVEFDLLNQKQNVLVAGYDIDLFARGKDFILFSTSGINKVSKLWKLDLTTGVKNEIAPLGMTFTTSKIVAAPHSNLFALSLQPGELRGQNLIYSDSSRLFVYNAETGSFVEQKTNNTLDVDFLPDGSGLLLRGSDAIYYLFDIKQQESFDLGRHFATGGVNSAGNKIVFVDFDPLLNGAFYPNINIYNKDRSQVAFTDGTEFVIDPQFFYRKEGLVFAQKSGELDGSRGLFSIVSQGFEQEAKAETISLPNVSLELPKLSEDDRYILVEKYEPGQLLDYENMRNFVFQTKPYSAKLVVYDRKSQSWIEGVEISGVSAVWH